MDHWDPRSLVLWQLPNLRPRKQPLRVDPGELIGVWLLGFGWVWVGGFFFGGFVP